MPSAVNDTNTTVFEDATNLISIGNGLPFVGSGDTVTGISTDDVTFTPVPANGTTASVNATYLTFAVDGIGNLTASPYQSNQAIIDAVNANGSSSTPLSDSLYYQVTDSTGVTSVYQLVDDLGDIGFQTPSTAPYGSIETVAPGTTTDISGVTVDKGLSSGQTDNSGDTLTVSVGVFDFTNQAPDGTVSIDPSVAGGGGSVSDSPDGSSVTIVGTIGQIDADLSTLTYTAVSTGTDAIIVNVTDSPDPDINQIVGNISVGETSPPMPVDDTNATIFEVLANTGGSEQGLPDVSTGDTVIGISTDDETFTPVPQDGTQASVSGTDLTFTIDDTGNVDTTLAQGNQAVIDAINANDGSSTPLSDSLYYEVQDSSATVSVDQYTFDLGDTGFTAPNSQPYSSPATVGQGNTIAIGGATVTKALSSDGTYAGTSASEYTLSASIGVFDFDRQAPDGTVAIDPTVAGGGGTVSYAIDHSSVTIFGTLGEINADLTTLTYTAVQTGTDEIDISDIDGPTPSANQIIGSIDVEPAATCYCAGTLIATPAGEVAVEALRIGDWVVTADGAAEAVKWIGRRSYCGAFIAGRHLMLPICFKAGALGGGLPRADLWVSPGHGMLVDGCLVPAWRLVNGVSVTQAARVDTVTYYHVELHRHAVLLANGAEAESFLDDGCRGLFQNAAEFHARYPVTPAGAPAATRLEDGFALELIRDRLATRAGVFVGVEPVGPLRGFVDVATPDRVCGWAQDVGDPEQPVALEVLVGGQGVLCLLANAYRADLRHFGIGSGCHAFDAALPDGFEGAVVIRRIVDGAVLPLTVAATERVAA